MEPIFAAQVEGTVLEMVLRTDRLDAAAAARFKSRLAEIWPSGLTGAAIDLSQVTFIDSSGVGALLSVYRRFPEGTDVTLRAVNPQVLAVLELLRLHKIFSLAP
jgi:anti-sigma B factor antagonist